MEYAESGAASTLDQGHRRLGDERSMRFLQPAETLRSCS